MPRNARDRLIGAAAHAVVADAGVERPARTESDAIVKEPKDCRRMPLRVRPAVRVLPHASAIAVDEFAHGARETRSDPRRRTADVDARKKRVPLRRSDGTGANRPLAIRTIPRRDQRRHWSVREAFDNRSD